MVHPHCILGGGEISKFKIIAADQLDSSIVSNNVSSAVRILKKKVDEIRGCRTSLICPQIGSGGYWFFGLHNRLIKQMLKELPGCPNVIFFKKSIKLVPITYQVVYIILY